MLYYSIFTGALSLTYYISKSSAAVGDTQALENLNDPLASVDSVDALAVCYSIFTGALQVKLTLSKSSAAVGDNRALENDPSVDSVPDASGEMPTNVRKIVLHRNDINN
jgi:hypothetical protein